MWQFSWRPNNCHLLNVLHVEKYVTAVNQLAQIVNLVKPNTKPRSRSDSKQPWISCNRLPNQSRCSPQLHKERRHLQGMKLLLRKKQNCNGKRYTNPTDLLQIFKYIITTRIMFCSKPLQISPELLSYCIQIELLKIFNIMDSLHSLSNFNLIFTTG